MEPRCLPITIGHMEPDQVEHTDADTADTALDLDVVERDLADVEAALRRLDDGTYFTDEITGQPIPADVLEANPTARRA